MADPTNLNVELQLQKINSKLDRLTNPLKVAGLQFVAGLFHSLGNFFGFILISLAIAYFLSTLKLDINGMVTKYVQNLVPKPQINIQSPF